MAYAKVEEFKASVGSLSGKHDDEIEDALAAASAVIDHESAQTFDLEAAAEARIYVVRYSGRTLSVDNIASVTGLEVKRDDDADGSFADETAWAATDYELQRFGHLNADKGREAKPWNEIYVPSWSTKTSWVKGERVQVTAVWGWAAVPAEVKSYCIKLAKLILNVGPEATQSIPELSEVLGQSPLAIGIMRRLREINRIPVVA